jgi:hypothetical protein
MVEQHRAAEDDVDSSRTGQLKLVKVKASFLQRSSIISVRRGRDSLDDGFLSLSCSPLSTLHPSTYSIGLVISLLATYRSTGIIHGL